MRQFYFEEGLDELLHLHNPNGGRPMKIGQFVAPAESAISVNHCEEQETVRYFMGYCNCGKKIVIGAKRAETVARMFQKRGITPKEDKTKSVVKIARLFLKLVDKSYTLTP